MSRREVAEIGEVTSVDTRIAALPPRTAKPHSSSEKSAQPRLKIATPPRPTPAPSPVVMAPAKLPAVTYPAKAAAPITAPALAGSRPLPGPKPVLSGMSAAGPRMSALSAAPSLPANSSPAAVRPLSAPVALPSPAPIGMGASGGTIIPFAKPRAISALPVTFSAGSAPSAMVGSTWGSAALAAAPAMAPAPVAPAPMVAPHDAATTVAAPLFDASPSAPSFPYAAPPPATPSRWAAFEKLGLGAPKIDHKKLSGHVVTAYRLLGFIILTIIVVVLIGYLVTTAFFYMSNSWIVPTSIAPTDEKVVSLQAQLAERQTTRDKTAADLDEAERAIAVQQEFQAEFAKAIKSDLDGRKAALARMHQLADVAAQTRVQIKRSNSAYASASKRRMDAEWRAGLIDRDAMLNGKFQIAQISSSNLSLAERQAEYEERAADLDAQTRALEALLSDTATDGSLSYDVLKIKQEYEASRLETQRAVENAKMLRTALDREDKLVASLQQSSYLKALADGASVAFVPYSNLAKVKKGEPLYGCRLTMMFCKKVGTVLDVLPGEVQGKHPNRDKMLRGQMVELKLDEASTATDDVLFVGGRPMLL